MRAALVGSKSREAGYPAASLASVGAAVGAPQLTAQTEA